MFKTLAITCALIIVTSFLNYAFAEEGFAEIKKQAQFSDDTYLQPEQIASSLKQQGQKLIHQAEINESQVSYFISEAKGIQTIAVRGTANLQNVMLDLSIKLHEDPKLKIILHEGFGSTARAVYKDLAPYLDKDKKIQITGHSLGGAIAVVLGMYLKTDGYQVDQIITFGQPKVTNVTGANTFADLPLIRVVTPLDIVPLVPPISPMQIKDLDIYWHMGVEVILMGDHQYAVTSGIKSMLRATKFTTSIPDEKNLTAHQMTTYLNRIDGLQDKAEEIPYKMDINLFGLSID